MPEAPRARQRPAWQRGGYEFELADTERRQMIRHPPAACAPAATFMVPVGGGCRAANVNSFHVRPCVLTKGSVKPKMQRGPQWRGLAGSPPVGHGAAAVQAAQYFRGGGHQDGARRLQVDHVRRRVHHPQRSVLAESAHSSSCHCRGEGTILKFQRLPHTAAGKNIIAAAQDGRQSASQASLLCCIMYGRAPAPNWTLTCRSRRGPHLSAARNAG